MLQRLIQPKNFMVNITIVSYLLLLSGCSSNVSPQVNNNKPNIVIIMADDMGWGDTSFNGNNIAVTPNIDDMAASGAVFNRFYSASPVCSPTRGSVLTGRHPFRYGIYYANKGALPQEELTLAELLKQQGYHTGFFGKWHLGTLTKTEKDGNRGGRAGAVDEYSPPWLHGFDNVFATESKVPTYDPMVKPKGPAYKNRFWQPVEQEQNGEYFGTTYWLNDKVKETKNLSGDDSRVITDRVVPFIKDSVAEEKPFLAVLWTHTPHLPIVASKSDQAAINSDNEAKKIYYGSIKAMDEQIGRVRAILKQQGIADNTLIWFTSDNGPELTYGPKAGSKGKLRAAKRSLYEGGIRVPGIIEWPEQIAKGVKLATPAVTSDILPTILDYLGITYPDARVLDGQSLKPLLQGTKTSLGRTIGFESAHRIALIGDRYKLIYEPVGAELGYDNRALMTGQNPSKALPYKLYDLIADPEESKDISKLKPQLVKTMRKELDDWRNSVATSISTRSTRH